MANSFQLNEVEISVALSSTMYRFATREGVLVTEPDMENRQQIVEMFVNNIDPDLLIDVNQLVLHSMISEGCGSIVYSGLYRSYPVAVKIIKPGQNSAIPDRRATFEREVLILSKLKHENIVELVGASVDPVMMIVTELMRGSTLQRYLWSLRPNCLDLDLAIKFALDISRAMQCLHSNGVIHRNLKPANLLLTNDMKTIKVASFGLATEATEEEKTIEAGTYRWMAPELYNTEALATGRKYYDHKVDVYSFSMILWELLTNTTPFKGRTSVSLVYAVANNIRPSVEDIPPELVPLLESCWSGNPACRPEFSEITSVLEDFYQSLCPVEIQPLIPSIIQVEEAGQTVDPDAETEPGPGLEPRLEPELELESKLESELEPMTDHHGCEVTVVKPGKKVKTKMSHKVLRLVKKFLGCFHKKVE